MPKVFELHRTQTLPIALETAWAFFSDPANHPAITPPELGFKILATPPARIHAGLMLRYSVRPLPGFRAQWVSEITQARAPDYFVDEQRVGPYALWHHEHHFRAVPGGVEAVDHIHYILPLGPLGSLLAGPLVRRRLERIFAFRALALQDRFGIA